MPTTPRVAAAVTPVCKVSKKIAEQKKGQNWRQPKRGNEV
jgi:hypothetical protein